MGDLGTSVHPGMLASNMRWEGLPIDAKTSILSHLCQAGHSRENFGCRANVA